MAPEPSQTLLVTGGSGYLGSELLRQAGGRAVGTRHTAAGPGEALDVRDAAAVARLFRRVRPACVIHTAYRQSGPDMRATNVDGSANVAKAARSVGARLLHLSTDVVFDGCARAPYREEAPVSPVTEYGRAKSEAEEAVAAIDPAALIVRTSLLYGGPAPGPHEQMVLDAAAGLRDVRLFTDEIRSPIAVADLAGALLELAERDAAGVLHVAGPEPLDRLAFGRALAEAAGLDPDRLVGGRSGEADVVRPRYCALDSGRATALLDVRLRAVGEVLRG